MQSEISTATLVGYRKTITPDPDIPFPNDRKTNASRSDDDDPAIAPAMSSNTGDRCIVAVDNGLKRMRLLYEVFERAFAAHSSEADGGAHRTQSVLTKPCIRERCPASNLDFGECPLGPEPQRGGAGNTSPKNTAVRILDARAAAGAAAIHSDEEWSGRH